MGAQGLRREAVIEELSVGLGPVSARPPLFAYIRDVAKRWPFIRTMATSQLDAKHGKDRLGSAWLILTPLLNAGTYFIVFGLLLQTRKGIDNYIGFLVVGVFLFQYTVATINQGSRVMAANRKMIQSLSFPRAVLPVSLVLRQFLAVIPALGVMVVLVLAIPPHAELSWRWLLMIPLLLVQTMFNLGVVLILARVVAKVNDISNVLTFTTRALMYFSGIFYSFERFADNPPLQAVLELNPVAAFLTIARDCLLYNTATDISHWIVAVAWSLPLFVIGVVVFWRAELEYAHV